MNTDRKKEIGIFLTALVAIAGSFVAGIIYLKGTPAQVALLADISNAVNAQNASSTPTSTPVVIATTTIETSTPTSSKPIASSTPVATTTKPVSVPKPATSTTSTTPPPVAKPTSTPVPAPVVVTKPTSTPPTVATTTAPTSTPIVVSADPSKLPFVENFFNKNDGWRNWYGNFILTLNSLTIGATKSNTGGGALLNGSSAWTDYTFNATADWQSGEEFMMVARYIDSKNYTECRFDQIATNIVQIDLIQYANGAQNILQRGYDNDFNTEDASNIKAYIKVAGVIGTCSFNNHVISNNGGGLYTLASVHGGIGFSAADSDKNNSTVIIKSVDVEKNY